MLPLSPDTAVLALDHDGRPVVTPDGAPVPELVVAVTPYDRGRGVGSLPARRPPLPALPSEATTGWPSTSTSATPPPGSIAARSPNARRPETASTAVEPAPDQLWFSGRRSVAPSRGRRDGVPRSCLVSRWCAFPKTCPPGEYRTLVAWGRPAARRAQARSECHPVNLA